MTAFTHLDEARRNAVDALRSIVGGEGGIERAVLVDDLFGKLRVVLWPSAGAAVDAVCTHVDGVLREAGQHFWTGTIWVCDAGTGEADRILYDSAWEDGVHVTPALRLDDRHRNRTAWFMRFRDPFWSTRAGDATGEAGPPIVVFYSFKGGVGRTTALSAFAIQRARANERVVVIDFDLDAPGVGVLLAADDRGTTAPWGVVDYLLERPHGEVPLMDYVHRCARESVTADGAISVIPAGRMDDSYLTKLSRVDLEIASPDTRHPLHRLLEDVRSQLNAEWILIDARAGLSPAAGLLLSGFAHLHVLFGTTSEQSLHGLRRIIHHLGAERLQDGLQGDCIVVQAMVPDNTVVAREATSVFNEQIEQMFRDHYLIEEGGDPEDRFWSVRDIDNAVAPHVPVPLPYREKLAFFSVIEDIADALAEEEAYRVLGSRIESRFPKAAVEEGEG